MTQAETRIIETECLKMEYKIRKKCKNLNVRFGSQLKV